MAIAGIQGVEQPNGRYLPACRPPLPRMTGKARRHGLQGPGLLYGTGVSLPEKEVNLWYIKRWHWHLESVRVAFFERERCATAL